MFRCISIASMCVSAVILSACSNSATSGVPSTFPSSNPPSWVNLYVANIDNNTITVYKPGGNEPQRTISQKINTPIATALDRTGNLYVSNEFFPTGCCCHGWVSVYAPGTTSVLRTITQGIRCPGALAFDAAGNLYVANAKTTCSGPSCSTASSILVYAAGRSSVLRTITQGVNWPTALSFDRAGNLYVANEDITNNGKHSTVTVYGPQSSSILRTIKGLVYASWLAFDAGGNLYVAHGGYPPGVNVYAPGSAQIVRSIPAVGPNLALDLRSLCLRKYVGVANTFTRLVHARRARARQRR